MAGLYLHIPFCKQACHYCDFHFSTESSDRLELCDAMTRELSLQRDYLGDSIHTIYLGGGTPSLLSLQEIEILFTAIHTHFSVARDAEITLEANPDDLSREKLRGLRAAGINRLSIGIQTFDDALLKFLNRAHDANTARKSLEHAREAGFSNFSIDLIYAIPGLTDLTWEATLEEALRYSPVHISSYALTIENRTVFGNWSKRGKLHAMEEDRAAQQFETLMEKLTGAGYEQYEISNFCKDGFCSQHNSNYWKQSHYLGVGPSAHSYNGDSRQFNIRNNARYIRSINEGIIPYERELLSNENKINEYILTTLRTTWGCNLTLLKNQLHDDLMVRCKEYISQLQERGLATIEESTLRLTRNGKLLADKITEDLMVSA